MFIIIFKRKGVYILSLIFLILVFASNYVLFASPSFDEPTTKSNYIILIYIEDSQLYLIENRKIIKIYKIATGKPSWPSPIGTWTVTEKSKWGGNFGGRWLGLNVNWGKFGIHGTKNERSIGSAASHGCIRMYNSDVRELYDVIPVGTKVIIANGSYGPFGTGFRDLKPGLIGTDVLAVQKKLNELGYFKGKETGIFEDDLKNALHKFQKDNHLKQSNYITLQDYNAMGLYEFE